MGKYNHPRIGRIIMAQGRDAANTALTTSFGAMVLQQFKIWTTEAAACLSGLCCRLNHHFKHVFFVNEVRRTNLGILAEEPLVANVPAVHGGQTMPPSFPMA